MANPDRRTRRLAACGLLAALSVALMMTSLLPFGAYCATVLATLPLIPAQDAWGSRWALAVYGAAAVLGLLLSPDRETALVFLAFGYYPALREKLQTIPSAALRLLGKLVLCNAGIGAVWAASVWIFLLPAEELAGSAVLGALLVVLGNLTFLLYDLALARLTALYRKRWRRLLLRWLGAEP